MKKYLSTLMFLLITIVALGQSNYQDVVYLKNGSVIRGMIIEQIPNKSIKIETADRNIFVYKMDEVEKMAKEQILKTSTVNYNNKTNYSQSETNYYGAVELGIQIGVGDYGMTRLKLNLINGYQINQNFSLNFGTGLRYYFDAESILIPIFLDFRANLSGNNLSPYLSLGAGYTFNASNDFEGIGLLLEPTVGVSFKVSDKSAVKVGLGYEMQWLETYEYHYNYYSDDYYYNDKKVNSGALSITVGLSF